MWPRRMPDCYEWGESEPDGAAPGFSRPIRGTLNPKETQGPMRLATVLLGSLVLSAPVAAQQTSSDAVTVNSRRSSRAGYGGMCQQLNEETGKQVFN